MTESTRPLVTVLTLVYNTSEHIIETLDAIRRQTYDSIQHIIIDDFSSDLSVDIVNKWIESFQYKCIFIKHEVNKGICACINEAIQIANGKYFTTIGDDLMMPYKIEKDVANLEASLNAAFCYSKMILRYVNKNEERGGDFYKGSDNLFYDYLAGKVTIAAPTVTYRRTIFEQVGMFDESLLFEDYDMFLRVLYKNKAVFINYYSVVYNINTQSIQSRRQLEVYNEFLNILNSKWKHLPNIWYYKNIRHQYNFFLYASSNKKEALKHLFPAISIFWRKKLYASLFRFIFVWR